MRQSLSYRSWKDYRYRFVPWIILKWRERTVRKPNITDKVTPFDEERALEDIKKLCEIFESQQSVAELGLAEEDIYDHLGFLIGKAKSNIKEGGTGIFVTKGIISKSSLVTLYPGTVYQIDDPLFFQSITNHFILRCIDGIMIDGQRTGLSKFIYKSCAKRERIGHFDTCDLQWLDNDHQNLLGLGQFINNQKDTLAANVAYEELDIPITFPLRFRKFIPNVNYRPSWQILHEYDDITNDSDKIWIRTVALVALRDILEGEELYSNYFTQIST